jgi:DNA processing protein
VTASASSSQPQSVQDAPEKYGAERATRSAAPPGDALRALLRLANLQFSARLTLALLDHFAWDAERLFDASDAELDTVPAVQARHVVRLRDPAMVVTDRQWNWIEKQGVRLVLLPEEDYPRPLRDIPDPPPLLFVRGTLAETDRFSVGMVGSRHATPYGRNIAERMARELAGRGLTVVSGGAVGIDAAAHRGALAGGGRTLAVLGCGLDVDYPRDHRALFEQVVTQGALISEYPLGAQPEAWRFPLRNRIISGIAMGILVVEAPRQSGALITARCAAEHGRTLMAVPGNIDRQTSVGSNDLLKDGAVVVTETEDILRALNVVVLPARPEHQHTLDFAEETAEMEGIVSKSPVTFSAPDLYLPEAQRKLLECLSLTPQHIDAIAQQAGLSAMQAGVEMTLLEINGLIRRLPGNTYIRVL